jgi:hypothetical protein
MDKFGGVENEAELQLTMLLCQWLVSFEDEKHRT